MKKIKSKLNIFLYMFFMGLIFSSLCAQKAFSNETVRALEVPNKSLIESAIEGEDAIDAVNNSLGADYYKVRVQKNKPEFQIKNLADYLDEKRESKAASSDEEEKKEDIQIFCKEMEYFEDKNELEARDDVEIIAQNGVKVNAKKAIYNKDSNTIRLFGDVSIFRAGTTVTGDYMLIDMNEENALIDEPITNMGNINIKAKEGFAYSDRIENINGNIELNQDVDMTLSSQGFLRYGRAINDTRLVDPDLKRNRSKPYNFKTKEIVIIPKKDHDVVLFKNVDVFYKKKKILTVPQIEFFSDKESMRAEANFPLEFGSLKGFGMYLGMGYTFKLPKSYTFRVTPAVVYGESEFGVGAMANLKSDRMQLEAGWASSTNNLIVDGEFKVTDRLKLDVGRHAYKGEWFNGGTRAGYIAELSYDDSYYVEDLGGAIFRHRFSAGYVADYRRYHQEDDMQDGMRYRYQAQLSKDIKTFGSLEQDMFLGISAVGQVMATVYSDTGATVGLFRVGPSIRSRLKRWNSTISYTLGGVHGQTPYYFDEYRYGRQTVSFDESLILNKYISLGYRGTLTPLEDNRKKDLITENRLYAVVGPEDIKIAFSYDTIRQNMSFDFMFLLGSDNLDLKYDKLIINEPDKLGKKQYRQSDKALNKITVPEEL